MDNLKFIYIFNSKDLNFNKIVIIILLIDKFLFQLFVNHIHPHNLNKPKYL